MDFLVWWIEQGRHQHRLLPRHNYAEMHDRAALPQPHLIGDRLAAGFIKRNKSAGVVSRYLQQQRQLLVSSSLCFYLFLHFRCQRIYDLWSTSFELAHCVNRKLTMSSEPHMCGSLF